MYLGIDIGSSSSKAIVIDENCLVKGCSIINIVTGSKGPIMAEQEALEQAGITREQIKKCVVTGYGRMTYKNADKQITEISCHAMGVYHTVPSVRTIIDIGGQDAKVIRIGINGGVENFVMNEKCAAGTGRFMEVMARVLDCPLSELSNLANKGKNGVTISNTCTVVAESEMISQLAEGQEIERKSRE